MFLFVPVWILQPFLFVVRDKYVEIYFVPAVLIPEQFDIDASLEVYVHDIFWHNLPTYIAKYNKIYMFLFSSTLVPDFF